MGLDNPALQSNGGSAIVNEFPSLKGRRSFLGESDPKGCSPPSAGSIRAECLSQRPRLYGVYVSNQCGAPRAVAPVPEFRFEGAVTWLSWFDRPSLFRRLSRPE